MKKSKNKEIDSVFFLKLVLYLILGSFWVKLSNGVNLQIPIPVGFILGMILASHEHFQIDRKIEFALLLITMFVGFWLPIGIYIGM